MRSFSSIARAKVPVRSTNHHFSPLPTTVPQDNEFEPGVKRGIFGWDDFAEVALRRWSCGGKRSYLGTCGMLHYVDGKTRVPWVARSRDRATTRPGWHGRETVPQRGHTTRGSGDRTTAPVYFACERT